jgi:hypothetical protein
MFLHTYTFATNRIPLVLEELPLCRNLHQIQVESIEMVPLGKAQLSKKGKNPTREQTGANPHQHRGIGLESSPQRKAKARPSHPRHRRARGTVAPCTLWPGPTLLWWFTHKWGLAVRGWIRGISPQPTRPSPYIRGGGVPHSLTHTHTHTHTIWSSPPPLHSSFSSLVVVV